MDNVRYLKPRNDRERFFDSEESYQAYLKADEELKKEPLGEFFDWRYFLKVLFGRV
jgi:hypothetical protein